MAVKTRGKIKLKRLVYGRTLITILALMLQIVLMLGSWLWLIEGLPALMGGMVVFTAVMLVFILNTRENPTFKLSWCVLIAIAPLVGTVIYLFFKLDIGHKAGRRLLERSIADSNQYRPDTELELKRIQKQDLELYGIARYLQNNGAVVCRAANAEYFSLGEELFSAMLRELSKAEKFIFLEYFAIAPGKMWDQILTILEEKAAQGVEVRVLYDGGCAVSYLPHDYPKILKDKGIQCKVFSPFRALISTHYNNRDHRKIMVIDGEVAFTGGVNILDRYINQEVVFGHWKDNGILVRGAAASEFTRLFLQMWNMTERRRDWERWLHPVTDQEGAGYIIPFGDGPHDDQRVCKMVYLDMLSRAKDYVYIMTPYLILDNEMVTALTFAAARGVDVRLVLPHIPDKKYAFALAQSHYEQLLDAGVGIYEYIPGFVHAKTFLCDDRYAVVGTSNLDYRSLYLHYECGAYLYRLPVLQDIYRDFQNLFEISCKVDREMAKRRGVFSKLAGFILKIAAPLM